MTKYFGLLKFKQIDLDGWMDLSSTGNVSDFQDSVDGGVKQCGFLVR